MPVKKGRHRTRQALRILLAARIEIADRDEGTTGFICHAIDKAAEGDETSLASEMRHAVLRAIRPHYVMDDWLNHQIGRWPTKAEARRTRLRWLDSWIAAHRAALGESK